MSDQLPENFVFKDLIRLTDDKERFSQFLFDTGLLGWWENDICQDCLVGKVRLRKDAHYSVDGGCWRCTNKSCGRKISLRNGSWFSGAKLPLGKVMEITYHWVQQCANDFITYESQISHTTTADWKNFCREVCEMVCYKEKNAVGGPGMTVEIDESKFGKRKYHRGRRVDGQWVFGGICRETGECFFEAVEKRNADTLLPIICQYIRPGSTIFSDCWKPYAQIPALEGMNYRHLTVNHSKNFVDPITGCHTNRIESTWHALKSHALPRSGTQKHLYSGYFAEYCVRRKYLDNKKNRFGAFLDLVKSVYIPRKPTPRGKEN